MAKTQKFKNLPVLSNLTGAKVIGLDANGNDAQMNLDAIVRPETNYITATSSPIARTRFAGETYYVEKASYGTALANFGGVTVPVEDSGKVVFDGRVVWNNGAWQAKWAITDKPTIGANTVVTNNIASNAVTPEKTNFFSSGKNKLNYLAIEEGRYVGPAGTFISDVKFSMFSFLAKPNQVYTYSGTNAGAIYAYARFEDINGNLLGVFAPPNGNMPMSYTTPANTYKVYQNAKVNNNAVTYTNLQIEEGSPATAYAPFVNALSPSYIDLTAYYTGSQSDLKFALATSVSSLQSSLNAVAYIDPANYKITKTVSNPATTVYQSGVSFSSKSIGFWLKGVTKKRFNSLIIPLNRDVTGETFFTDGVRVKAWLNGVYIVDKTIPLSELTKYNALTRTSPAADSEYTILLDTPLFFNPGDLLFIGMECVAASDKIGIVFRTGTASDDAEWTRNYIYGSSTAGAIINRTTPPATQTSSTYFYRFSLGLAANGSSSVKQDLPILPLHKLYSVCNDYEEFGFNRTLGAPYYIDHIYKNITEELDIKFKETGTDKAVFTSRIDTDLYGVANNINNGVNVDIQTKSLTITGNDVVDKTISFKHISTKASVGLSKTARILTIGDSIGWGQMQNVAGDTSQADSWIVNAQEMFKKDWIDSGSVAGTMQSVFLGTWPVKLKTINYKGNSLLIKACGEGRRGWNIADYFGQTTRGQNPVGGDEGQESGNPFYDSTVTGSIKFSIKSWLNRYRTLADDGVTRLALGAAGIGSNITNSSRLSKYDVCLPTHINIMLAANNPVASTFGTNMKAFRDLIKAEYAANGWGTVYVSFSVTDTCGTYFPSRYPMFPKDIAFYNNTNAHNTTWDQVKNYLDTFLATDTEDADKTYLLPFYWTQPTAWSVAYRNADEPGFQVDEAKYATRYKVPFGWLPYVHPNGIAAMHFAYQYYSWVKYTQTL